MEGGAVYEIDRITSELGLADQQGPIYWSRSSDVSFVGVPAPTPEKRAIMAWHHTIVADDVSEDFLKLFDNVVDWMTGGKADNHCTPHSGKGILFRSIDWKPTAIPSSMTMNPAIYRILPRWMPSSKAVAGATRVASPSMIPLLSYRSTDHDDMLISSIGTTVTAELGQVSVPETGHPAKGIRLPLSSSPMRNLLI